ncbi:MAG: hypothetical protein F6K22_27510 [Okeania sp. SIO2F4]|uniref:hypothetical protein n=1 Tax=Okeania sp. SIO2F4 TaxID=2607790 RepID=UPI00142940C9|nr:hypothetical protein [Okeania sp. SIO2F4]NES06229.1 hypothetical protein [Okeania sp. SIO2F4]
METNIEGHIKGKFKVIGRSHFSVFFYSKNVSEIHPPTPIVTRLYSADTAIKIADKLNDVLEELKKEYQ